jgi:hypothetical protein
VPEHPDRDAAVPGKLPDTEHSLTRSTTSHRVRVNGPGERAGAHVLGPPNGTARSAKIITA